MAYTIENITELIESESIFFKEILSEYQFYLQVGNKPDGDWFNRLLIRRQVHIKKIEFIFNNKKYLNIFKNQIPRKVKKNFQKIIADILILDSQMKQILNDLQNKKSEQLVKIKKINKLIVKNTENISEAKVVNIAVK
ncbi:MAG: hypothetical protein CMF96_01060 [Candidatus Marinimicrobia bacterium]|nr:hypothetical protein [Candidatus Neomarinimicrobiota bacterium]|tara:strand:- start:7809 stop:8222 length:414 start_codon:yes stop_codon:yes gene_type:complete